MTPFIRVFAASVSFSALASGQSTPFFAGLTAPMAGTEVTATAISADGTTVVGALSGTSRQPFLWRRSTGTQALPLAATLDSTGFVGTSSDGSRLVVMGGATTGVFHAYSWTATGGYTFLPTSLENTMISDNGRMVMGESGYNSPQSGQVWRFYDNGGRQLIPRLSGTYRNEAIAVAGDGLSYVANAYYTTTQNQRAVRYVNGTYRLLPVRQPWSNVHALSGDGLVAFGFDTVGVVKWTFTDTTILFNPLAIPTTTIVRDADATGAAFVGTNEGQAVLWTEAGGLRLVADVAREYGFDTAGWTFTTAQGISADGMTITGLGINPLGQGASWVIHIPSPGVATFAFVGIGGLALGRARRR